MNTDVMNLTLLHHATPGSEVLCQEVGGEAVLLDLASERYFGLNPVGTRLWQLLGENDALQPAFDAMKQEFDVEPERLQADLLALVAELAEAGLVTVH